MIDLDKLGDLWRGSPPHALGARCLNVRHRARECRICVEACPVDAISIPDQAGLDVDPVVLDRDTCVRCGLCLNACPTGVFAQPEPPEVRLPSAIAAAPSQVIELACPRKEPPELSQIPGASVVQAPRCLAALSVPALLELATSGKTLWLNDGICQTCPIGTARHAIQRTISVANRWLEVMGHAPAIRDYLEAAGELAEEPAAQPVTSQTGDVMSRRDFFRSLTRQTSQAAAGALGDKSFLIPGQSAPKPGSEPSGPDAGESSGHRLAHHIPAQRQNLARALRKLAPDAATRVPTDALPIADVTISDACTACGLCAQFCPTEAITFLSDGEYYVLHFSAALCLAEDCKLCTIGCPTDAVRFGQEVLVEELLSTQPRSLKAGRLVPCSQCGAPTHAPMEEDDSAPAPLCYVCQARSRRPDLLSGLPRR